jgi:hypothetical protein
MFQTLTMRSEELDYTKDLAKKEGIDLLIEETE